MSRFYGLSWNSEKPYITARNDIFLVSFFRLSKTAFFVTVFGYRTDTFLVQEWSNVDQIRVAELTCNFNISFSRNYRRQQKTYLIFSCCNNVFKLYEWRYVIARTGYSCICQLRNGITNARSLMVSSNNGSRHAFAVNRSSTHVL